MELVPGGIEDVVGERHRVESSLLCKTCNVFTSVFSKLVHTEEVEKFMVRTLLRCWTKQVVVIQ